MLSHLGENLPSWACTPVCLWCWQVNKPLRLRVRVFCNCFEFGNKYMHSFIHSIKFRNTVRRLPSTTSRVNPAISGPQKFSQNFTHQNFWNIYNKFSIEVIENYFYNLKTTKQNPRTYLQRPGTRNQRRLPPLVTGRSSLGNRPEMLRNTICVAR